MEKNGKKKTIQKKNKADNELKTTQEMLKAVQSLGAENEKTLQECLKITDAYLKTGSKDMKDIEDFLSLCHEKMGKNWFSYLVQLSLKLNPHVGEEMDTLFTERAKQECILYLEQEEIPVSELKEADIALITEEDSSVLNSFLNRHVKKKKGKNESLQKKADLCRAVFVYTSLECKEATYDSVPLLIRLDRTIAEFSSKGKPVEMAGRTVGAILSEKMFSAKKMARLTYLYEGSSERIAALRREVEGLNGIKSTLYDRIERLKRKNQEQEQKIHELSTLVEQLEGENTLLKEEKKTTDDLMGLERNVHARQMSENTASVTKEIKEDISPELEGLRSMIEHLDEENRRRFKRRLDRIDRILGEY